MAESRPTFRVMKNGYDRFAVDDAVEKYATEVESLRRKVQLYADQNAQLTKQLNDIRIMYQRLNSQFEMKQKQSEEIARISLREANTIIATAQNNADNIIKDALAEARLILTELSSLYGSAGKAKSSMRIKLDTLIHEIDTFKLPELPDTRWLEEATRKFDNKDVQ